MKVLYHVASAILEKEGEKISLIPVLNLVK